MEEQTGHKVPNFTFMIRENYQWISKTTDEIFAHKRVVLFALPGAFSPVCSALLPRYNDLYDTFRANGIDDVVCLSQNDAFVLNEWKRAEKADKITMLPDPDGEFSAQLGFPVNKNEMCLNYKSWRYSMVVNDGVIEKMFIESDVKEGDPYGESSAEAILKYLNPNAKLPESVTIFSKEGCLLCARAKDLLQQYHLPYEELVLNKDISLKTVKAISGTTDIPQVFINGIRYKNLNELRRRFKPLKVAS